MKKVIWKYPISRDGVATQINVSSFFIVLDIQKVGNEFFAWIQVEPESPQTTILTIEIIMTGQEFCSYEKGQHFKTIIEGAFVWHFFYK